MFWNEKIFTDTPRHSKSPHLIRKLSLAAALVAGMLQFSWGTDYSAWKYNQVLTITPDSLVTAAVTNFPLLVYLTSSDSAVFTTSMSNGFDVRFTSLDASTDLPFQRQSFNDSTKTAEFWVLVPSIAANPGTTQIRMFWGNSAAADAQNPGATFSTAAGYRAVWHMNATAGSNEPDATGSGHALVPTASPSVTSGPVGAGVAKSFDGASQYFVAQNSGGDSSTLNFPAGGPLTISAWINPASSQNCDQILGKINTGDCGTWTGSYGWCFNGSTAGDLRFNSQNGASGFERCYYAISPSQWTHVVWVLSDTGTALTSTNVYINGVASGTTDSSNMTNSTRTDSLSFTMGVDAFVNGVGVDSSLYWGGAIQEVQIAAGAWTPSWIGLAYQDQSSPSTLISMGTVSAVLPGLAARHRAQPLLSLRDQAIEYALPKTAAVEISFFDILGKSVLAINRSETAGSHMLKFKDLNLSAGTYLVRLKSAGAEGKILVNITQ